MDYSVGNYEHRRLNLNIEELKRIQDYFAETVGIYCYCLDSAGMPVTKASGDKEDLEKFGEIVSNEQLDTLRRRVSIGDLEDQTIENTIVPNMKYGAVAVKIQKQTILTWVFFAVLTDASEDGYMYKSVTDFKYMISEKRLMKSLDLLREASVMMLAVRLSASSAEAESMRSKFSEVEMLQAMKRKDTMTEVVKLLDSDEAIENIMYSVLRMSGMYMELSSAKIFSIKRSDSNLMDTMCKWYAPGVADDLEQVKDLKRYSFIYSDKVMAVGSEATLPDLEMQKEREELGISAMVIIPMEINGMKSMYALFEMKNKVRAWDLDELKFLNDVIRVLQSIITRRIQKNSLAGSYASLEMILNNIGNAIYVRDCESKQIVFANSTLRNGFKEELEADTLAELFETKIDTDSVMGSLEIQNEITNRWYELYYTDITWMNGKQALLCSIHEVTEKKEYQKQIERQAQTDFLTGLYNRMCCERDLAKYIDYAKKENKQGALIYLDLDDFKHINDGLGHKYGDVLLQSIAHSMNRVEGIQGTCYRMGGDEFVIIVQPDNYHMLSRILDEMKQIFNRPWFLKDTDYYCTMSMGVVPFPDEGDNVAELIKKADIAMYQAKKGGKNRICEYRSGVESESSRRLDMEKAMRDAAAEGFEEFLVYFQPIIDVQQENQPCVGAEALLRWDSKQLGFVSPGEFIPLAEYLGIIIPLGEYVLRKACMACKQWNEHGHPDYKVNVNLSVLQLTQADILDTIKGVLEETGINPNHLSLEVTESLAINDMDTMQEVLSGIRNLGVRIALDDFGTGYSSLNHLRELPLDVIKVDQSFVKDLDVDLTNQKFVKMIADLAEGIGKRICVEGVETKEQLQILNEMAVCMLQGFFFDRPMPQADFEAKYVNVVE